MRTLIIYDLNLRTSCLSIDIMQIITDNKTSAGNYNMSKNIPPNNSEILIYQTEDGQAKVEVIFDNETVWLTQTQMGELFQKTKSTINEHLQNIFEEGELNENEVMTKFGISEFSRQRPVQHYNLDAIKK